MKKTLIVLFVLLLLSVSNYGQKKPVEVYPLFNDTELKVNLENHSSSSLLTAKNSSVSLLSGAERLFNLQNDDGGWDWPLDDGNSANSSPKNTIGPIARGLAEAYNFTGNPNHLSAIQNAGAFLLTKTAFSTSDGYLAAKLDQLFGVTTYTDYVKTNFYDKLADGTYDRNGTLHNDTTYVELVRNYRTGTSANLSTWDLGMGVVSAHLCGANTDLWVEALKAEINELNASGYYDVIGLAGGVLGLAIVGEDFDPTAGQHSEAGSLADLANILASYQIDFGGFAWNANYVVANDGNEGAQVTAYSILALNEFDRTLFIKNIEGAAKYLQNAQLITGGWSNYIGGGENNEITAEALWGVGVAFPELYVDAATGNDSNDGSKAKPFATIQPATGLIPFNGTISVEPGNYPNVILDNPLNLVSANGPAATTIAGTGGAAVTVTSDNIFIDGFTITNPTGPNAILSIDNSNLTITNNIISNIGSTVSTFYVHAIAAISTAEDVNNVVIKNNTLDAIAAGDGKSASAISAGWSNGDFDIVDLLIEGNAITNVSSSILDWPAGHGAYGILINHGTGLTGKTVNAQILNNTISNLEGLWAHGIGLEGNTPNAVLMGNDISNLTDHKTPTDGWAIFFEANPSMDDVTIKSNVMNNVPGGIAIHPDLALAEPTKIVMAENNWWGDATGPQHATNPAGTGAYVTDNVDFSPWTTELTVTAIATPYSFPSAGVEMSFTTLPVGGGTVTIQRFAEIPAGYPVPLAGATHVGLWLDFTSSMDNFTFDATITIDVTGLGFDANTSIMYFNTETNSWVAINNGTYTAGPPETFTFTTNHFTSFSFINTPATAYNIFLASTAEATASEMIYPNTNWGFTPNEPDDWSFTAPTEIYIVPEDGAIFGACDLVIQWDNSIFTFNDLESAGGMFDGASLMFTHEQLGETDQITINASKLDNNNFTAESGDFIAKLKLNIIKPGYGAINFTGLDFRAFDGEGSFEGVYMVGNGTALKSYLGDVASPGDESTGDGIIDIEDLSLWTSSYWSGVPGYTGPNNYKVKYDIGPTADNTVYSLPQADGKIQFEDMVIFAISYGLSGDNVYPKLLPMPETPLVFEIGKSIKTGTETVVPVYLNGAVADVRAAQLSFSGKFGKLVSVEKGSLLENLEAPVVLMNNSQDKTVNVDLAVFGTNAEGVNSEGELLLLRFEGEADIQLSTANLRNSFNQQFKTEISNSLINSVPVSYALEQNYPNPFNPSTTITYQLPEQNHVNIIVFNMLGEEVANLVDEVKEAGYYKVQWNSNNLSSGVYFYRIEAGDFIEVKKMVFMK